MTKNVYDSSFLDFCVLLQQLSETKSTTKKIQLFASALIQANSSKEAGLMAQFVGEGIFASTEKKRASIGPKLAAECCSKLCDIDYERVFKACKQATGSGSEAIALLLTNMRVPAKEPNSGLNPSLTELVEMAEDFSILKKKTEKEAVVLDWMQKLPPISVRYLIRIFSQHSLRIGFELRSVLQAVAVATHTKLEQIRYAHLVTGSLAKTTELAFAHKLEEARFKPFHPMAFMLASPVSIKEFSPKKEQLYLAEEKLDGMRAQIHTSANQVAIYSRDMNDISGSFPELLSFFSNKLMPTCVLDGEIVVFKENTIQPFSFLQQRMGVKKPSKKLLSEYPVHFIAYDLLYHEQTAYFEKPLSQRREKLEEICRNFEFSITKQYELAGINEKIDAQKEALQRLFDQAISHGNEGLLLKEKTSVYEYGQRKKSWLKIKEPIGNLDTVIMYAHAGSGKRGGLYSDFTLGISVSNDERFSEDFIPIGKAYGGFTDAELKQLNVEIKKLSLQRFGPTLSVKTEIVVELEFEQIMQNKRTKAGYTLRLPRFKAIRWDKDASQTNSLKDVEQMYSSEDGLRRKGKSEEQGVTLNEAEGGDSGSHFAKKN